MDYLHTYSPQEQERLRRQAEFLREHLHPRIRLNPGQRVLEIGCGVGAQLGILSRFPGVDLVGVDRSPEQLEEARRRFPHLELHLADAEALPFPGRSFDQVIIFFVLEHVREPLPILREARRVLKRHGVLTVTEVFNHTFFTHPETGRLRELWRAYNQLQIDLGGDPEVGAKLPNLAISAGFRVDRFDEIGPVLDRRLRQAERRLELVHFWRDIFESARERLVAEGRVDLALVTQAYAELEALAGNPDGILFYAGRQLEASLDA